MAEKPNGVDGGIHLRNDVLHEEDAKAGDRTDGRGSTADAAVHAAVREGNETFHLVTINLIN